MAYDSWLLVDTPAKAGRARRDIDQAEIIGMDTEYDSLRYFREKLCLIQIRADGSTYVFDPLGDLDLSFLGERFADPSLRKVLHAGDNDIRLLKRDYDFSFANIFDTYRAASLLGCEGLSLAHVVGAYLGVPFEKTKRLQRSRWDQRPLTEEQLRYAVADTAHLVDLSHRMEEEISCRGLGDEAARIFEDMTENTWRKKQLDRRGHRKVERFHSLTDREQKRLKHLFRWRYGKAEEINRAAFLILSDKDLVHLSGLEIASLSDLSASGALPQEKIHLFGADLVEVLAMDGEGTGTLN